jgi:hypothetical protein
MAADVTVDVGDWRQPKLTVTPADGTTVATLTVVKPDNTTVTPVVTGSVTGGVGTYTAPLYELTLPGEWHERWDVSGQGAGAEVRVILAVAPTPVATGSPVHATVKDYSELIGGAAPDNLPQLLRRASRDIDCALLSAFYDDTDATVLAALREATVERARWYVEQGWGAGIPAGVQSFSIGSISITRDKDADGADDGLDAQSFAVLQLAGLTGHAPANGW